MKGLLARLKKKIGPLPLWAWASIASSAGWFLLKRGSKADLAATQTAAEPAYVSAGDTGDLAPLGSPPGADSTPVTTPGEAFPDKGITSDFQDFMNQLFAQELASRSAEKDGEDGSLKQEPPAAEAVDPTKAKTIGKLATKARAAGLARPRPKKKSANTPKPKPKKKPPPHTGGRRSTGVASHGSGGAGARPRAARKSPVKLPARPRAAAKPKPKPKAKKRQAGRQPGQRGRPH